MEPLADQVAMVQPASKEEENQGGQHKAEIPTSPLSHNIFLSMISCRSESSNK